MGAGRLASEELRCALGVWQRGAGAGGAAPGARRPGARGRGPFSLDRGDDDEDVPLAAFDQEHQKLYEGLLGAARFRHCSLNPGQAALFRGFRVTLKALSDVDDAERDDDWDDSIDSSDGDGDCTFALVVSRATLTKAAGKGN